jgi:hypothetical protein
MIVVRARTMRQRAGALLAFLSVSGLLAACNLSTENESAKLEVAVRPETTGTLVSSGAKSATVTLTGIGIGAPAPFRSTASVVNDSAIVKFSMKLPGAGGNFTMAVAVANAAGDTIFRYPSPGFPDQQFGILNGADQRIVAYVVRIP